MTITTIPNEKRLIEAFGDKGPALYAVLKGRTDPMEYASVAAWVRACWHPPSAAEMVFKACDEILEGYGTEAITLTQDVMPRAEYVNLGDTYETTLIWDYGTERVRIGAWGDYVERFDRA